jgi:hypothetical protein
MANMVQNAKIKRYVLSGSGIGYAMQLLSLSLLA